MGMDKKALFEMVNNYAQDRGTEPIDIDEFVLTLSSLEAKGLVYTDGDQVYTMGELN